MSHEIGDVFQINERYSQPGWVGAFLLATEVKSWGVMGFVSCIQSSDKQGRAYVRIPFDSLDYIGKAAIIPGEANE